MEKILVTGGSGFIGRPLVKALLKKGYLIRSTSRVLSEDSKYNGCGTVEHYSFDLGDDSPDYARLLANVDVVIHLAARVHAAYKPKDNVSDYHKINTKGTERLVNAASVNGIKRFIFLSSIKVNGEKNISDAKGKILSFNEGNDPHPQEAYANSKLDAEDAIRKICHESKMDYIILRPTLVYGPGVRANFLSLIDVVNKNYPLPFASIKNKRHPDASTGAANRTTRAERAAVSDRPCASDTTEQPLPWRDRPNASRRLSVRWPTGPRA